MPHSVSLTFSFFLVQVHLHVFGYKNMYVTKCITKGD